MTSVESVVVLLFQTVLCVNLCFYVLVVFIIQLLHPYNVGGNRPHQNLPSHFSIYCNVMSCRYFLERCFNPVSSFNSMSGPNIWYNLLSDNEMYPPVLVFLNMYR